MIKKNFCLCLLLFLMSACANEKESRPPANLTSPAETGHQLIEPAPSNDQDEFNKETNFQKTYNLENPNSMIAFESPYKDYDTGDCILLKMENLSDSRIALPAEFGLKMVVFANGVWAEVGNTAKYIFPSGTTGQVSIPPRGTDIPAVIFIPACPDLSKQTAPIELSHPCCGTR
ncbi:MAG: hypothetical protein HY869_16190 [Chloroflexi bacterium]|nr:hypothetical protein [Chloroflexota bacterium]